MLVTLSVLFYYDIITPKMHGAVRGEAAVDLVLCLQIELILNLGTNYC